MRKTLSVLLVVCLLATLSVGLTLTTASAEAAEKLPVRYYMPGTGSTIDPNVITAVNEKMAADGLNLELQPMYIPWDAWTDKINIMLSSGEEFELFQIMSDYIPFNTYQGRGALAELDDVIANNAPELLTHFSEEMWSAAKLDGKIYTVPAEWRDSSGDSEAFVCVRQDKLDAAGLTLATDPLEISAMVDTLEKLQASWGNGVTPYVWDHSPTRPPVALHRSFDSWPFYTSLDGLFFVDQEGKVQAFFETDEFKQDCAVYRELYEKGLMHPDILSVPQDTKNKLVTDGDVLMGWGTFGAENETALKVKIPEASIAQIVVDPAKPALMTAPMLNSNSVPSTTKHPEAGVMFLNWLYSSKENHDLLIYGQEGTHYTVGEDGTITTALNENGEMLHRFDYWMIGDMRYAYYEKGTPQAVIDDWSGCTMEYVASPVLGFNFNSEPVKVEYAQVKAEYEATILPIKLGVVSYEENIEAALSNMKAAGIDAVVAEYQKQLDEYRAANQ